MGVRALWLLALGGAWVGCSFEDGGIGIGQCIDGQSEGCACEDGAPGARACSAGTFGACACGPTGGALDAPAASGDPLSTGAAGSGPSVAGMPAADGAGSGATSEAGRSGDRAGSAATPEAGATGAAGTQEPPTGSPDAGSAGMGGEDAAGSGGGEPLPPAEPGRLYGSCSQQNGCKDGLACTSGSSGTTTTGGYCTGTCFNGTGTCEQPVTGTVRAQCAIAGICFLESCQGKECPAGMECMETVLPLPIAMTLYDCRYPVE